MPLRYELMINYCHLNTYDSSFSLLFDFFSFSLFISNKEEMRNIENKGKHYSLSMGMMVVKAI